MFQYTFSVAVTHIVFSLVYTAVGKLPHAYAVRKTLVAERTFVNTAVGIVFFAFTYDFAVIKRTDQSCAVCKCNCSLSVFFIVFVISFIDVSAYSACDAISMPLSAYVFAFKIVFWTCAFAVTVRKSKLPLALVANTFCTCKDAEGSAS